MLILSFLVRAPRLAVLSAGLMAFCISSGSASENHSPRMRATKDPGSGQIDITDGGQPVLRYNYETREPGALLDQVSPDNRKYAKPRSDYIHPLYGLDGQTLTKDWSVDHPHHRGIYWAWPEVDYHGARGDLHALQRVFARPTGQCWLQSGAVFAQVDAENLWIWDDKTPIVRERAIIRAWPSSRSGRYIDLELQFSALTEEVAIARRGTEHYGGLNIRLAAVRDQQISVHTDPVGSEPRKAWADLSGMFSASTPAMGLTVFQHLSNFAAPGDWVQYPELNWIQPTFPASGTRYVLKPGKPLVLRFRLWIHRDAHLSETLFAEQWQRYNSEGALPNPNPTPPSHE